MVHRMNTYIYTYVYAYAQAYIFSFQTDANRALKENPHWKREQWERKNALKQQHRSYKR